MIQMGLSAALRRLKLKPGTQLAHSRFKWSGFTRGRESVRLIGRQSFILVDPFSPLHHQCVAWMLSGWSSLHAPPIPLGSLWSGTMSL